MPGKAFFAHFPRMWFAPNEHPPQSGSVLGVKSKDLPTDLFRAVGRRGHYLSTGEVWPVISVETASRKLFRPLLAFGHV